MIPQLVTVRWRRSDGRRRRLYVPVLLVAVVLWPLLLLAALGGVITCLVFGLRPLAVMRGVGRVLWALPGSRFEIEDGRTAVLVSIR